MLSDVFNELWNPKTQPACAGKQPLRRRHGIARASAERLESRESFCALCSKPPGRPVSTSHLRYDVRMERPAPCRLRFRRLCQRRIGSVLTVAGLCETESASRRLQPQQSHRLDLRRSEMDGVPADCRPDEDIDDRPSGKCRSMAAARFRKAVDRHHPRAGSLHAGV